MNKYKKVTLSISEQLWTKLVARVPRRKISRFVSEAAARRLEEEERARLKELIKEQSLARSERDLRIAEEFFAAEEEAERSSSP